MVANQIIFDGPSWDPELKYHGGVPDDSQNWESESWISTGVGNAIEIWWAAGVQWPWVNGTPGYLSPTNYAGISLLLQRGQYGGEDQGTYQYLNPTVRTMIQTPAAAGASAGVVVRFVDWSNYTRIGLGNGRIKVDEIIAGVVTNRLDAVATNWTDGSTTSRVRVIMDEASVSVLNHDTGLTIGQTSNLARLVVGECGLFNIQPSPGTGVAVFRRGLFITSPQPDPTLLRPIPPGYMLESWNPAAGVAPNTIINGDETIGALTDLWFGSSTVHAAPVSAWNLRDSAGVIVASGPAGCWPDY
jgi:hypothetical protein